MHALLALWLPILLSAVAVFVISSLIHMVFKWHASDYRAFANEDAVSAAIRAGQPTPGRYVLPYCSDMKDMASEGMKKKYEDGPVGHVTIMPNGAHNMGKYLGLWFLWSLAIAVAAAFIVSQIFGLNPARATAVAKLVGSVTFIAHGFGSVTESIWMGRSWSTTAKNLLDAALYGISSGLVFYYLWP
ncbi:MAG: hypothetical protein RL091_883 [Verrucomicrobiota bacterium]|jgi:hypothetical protein